MIKPVIEKDFSDKFSGDTPDNIDKKLRVLFGYSEDISENSENRQIIVNKIYDHIKEEIIKQDEAAIEARFPFWRFYLGEKSKLTVENVENYLLDLIEQYCYPLGERKKLTVEKKYYALLSLIQRYSNSCAMRLEMRIENEVNILLSKVLLKNSPLYKEKITNTGYEFASPFHHFFEGVSIGSERSSDKAYWHLLELLKIQATNYIISTLLIESALLHDFRDNCELQTIKKSEIKKLTKEKVIQMQREKDMKEAASLISIKKSSASHRNFIENSKFEEKKIETEYNILGDEDTDQITIAYKNPVYTHMGYIKGVFGDYTPLSCFLSKEELLALRKTDVETINENSLPTICFEHYPIGHNLKTNYKVSRFSKELALIYLTDKKNCNKIPVHFAPYINYVAEEDLLKNSLYNRCETYQDAELNLNDTNAYQKFSSLINHYNSFNTSAERIMRSLPDNNFLYCINGVLFNECTHPAFFSSIDGCDLFTALSDRIDFCKLYEYHVKSEHPAEITSKRSLFESTYYLRLLSLLMVFDIDLKKLNSCIVDILDFNLGLEEDSESLDKLNELNSIFSFIHDFLRDVLNSATQIIGNQIDASGMVNNISDNEDEFRLLARKLKSSDFKGESFNVSLNDYFNTNGKLIISYLIHYNAINGRVPRLVQR